MKRSIRNKKPGFPILLPLLTIEGMAIITTLSSFYEEGWLFHWNEMECQNITDTYNRHFVIE
jgi:hypothetical protein